MKKNMRTDDILDLYSQHADTLLDVGPSRWPAVLLPAVQRRALLWVRYAGLRPTIAELVRLEEIRLRPRLGYFGEENEQKLVNAIYMADSVLDQQLVNRMRWNSAMPVVLAAVQRLVERGIIQFVEV